jgi:uncharacterized RDD family membrane protein YckC
MADSDARFELQPATLDARLLAGLIDFVIGAFLAAVPVLGPLAAAAYWLVRDGLEVEFMNHRSIGKAIMKTRPVRPDGTYTSIDDSIRRNWMFAPAAVVPFLFYSGMGIFLVPSMLLLVMIITGVEIFLIVTDPLRQRLGDKVADTVVVEVED